MTTALRGAALFALLLGGCGTTPEPAAITGLLGEIHLHEYPEAGHAEVQFVAAPLPANLPGRHGLAHVDYAPTATQGPCSLFLMPSCQPACGQGWFCSQRDVCTVLPQLVEVDGGEVRITGSLVVPLLRLLWSVEGEQYHAHPPPEGPIFAGGEVLDISGAGVERFGFRGALPAPRSFEMLAPRGDETPSLSSGPLRFRWVTAEPPADQVELWLRVAQSNGNWGSVRCLVPDAGEATVPAEFLAALPGAPREVSWTLNRATTRLVPVAEPGIGVQLHAEYSLDRFFTE